MAEGVHRRVVGRDDQDVAVTLGGDRAHQGLRVWRFGLRIGVSLRERQLGRFRLLRWARELSGLTRRRKDGRTCRSIISMRLFCHPSFAEPKVLIPVRLRLVVALRRVNGPETSLDVS